MSPMFLFVTTMMLLVFSSTFATTDDSKLLTPLTTASFQSERSFDSVKRKTRYLRGTDKTMGTQAAEERFFNFSSLASFFENLGVVKRLKARHAKNKAKRMEREAKRMEWEAELKKIIAEDEAFYSLKDSKGQLQLSGHALDKVLAKWAKSGLSTSQIMEKVKQANRGLSEAELNSISGLVSTYIADIKANVLNPRTGDYYQF